MFSSPVAGRWDALARITVSILRCTPPPQPSPCHLFLRPRHCWVQCEDMKATPMGAVWGLAVRAGRGWVPGLLGSVPSSVWPGTYHLFLCAPLDPKLSLKVQPSRAALDAPTLPLQLSPLAEFPPAIMPSAPHGLPSQSNNPQKEGSCQFSGNDHCLGCIDPNINQSN